MSEARKMLESSGGGLATELLRSALDDEPSDVALHETAAAIGVVGLGSGVAAGAGATGIGGSSAPAATSLGGASAAGASAAGASAAGASAGLKAGLIGWGALKWVGIGTTAAAITAGGWELAGRNAPDAEPSPTNAVVVEAAPPAPNPSALDARSPLEADRRSEPEDSKAEASLLPERGLTLDATSGAASGAGGAPRLADEVQKLSDARAALVSGNAAGALSILDVYLRSERTHALDPEATILRIEALRVTGRVDEARALARAFIQSNPGSAHAPRLRAFLEGENASPSTEKKDHEP